MPPGSVPCGRPPRTETRVSPYIHSPWEGGQQAPPLHFEFSQEAKVKGSSSKQRQADHSVCPDYLPRCTTNAPDEQTCWVHSTQQEDFTNIEAGAQCWVLPSGNCSHEGLVPKTFHAPPVIPPLPLHSLYLFCVCPPLRLVWVSLTLAFPPSRLHMAH